MFWKPIKVCFYLQNMLKTKSYVLLISVIRQTYLLSSYHNSLILEVNLCQKSITRHRCPTNYTYKLTGHLLGATTSDSSKLRRKNGENGPKCTISYPIPLSYCKHEGNSAIAESHAFGLFRCTFELDACIISQYSFL